MSQHCKARTLRRAGIRGKMRVQTNRWEIRVRERIENNSRGSTVKISVGYSVAVACTSVCQCMCVIGFLPNWHVFKSPCEA